MRVLIVEDEIALADALQYILLKNGYQVDVVNNGIDGEAYACSGIYDVIVLDRMLPGREGVEILKAIRNTKLKTPTMFLTAKDSIDDRVEGLDAGADDYLIKPFSNKEFLARVKALSRRSETLTIGEALTISDTKLYIHKCIYEIDGKQISLTKTETQLLELFIRNRNQVLTKEQILERIWGFDNEVEIANVELYIYYLRKKIDFSISDIELKTVRGVGYTLLERISLKG
jgi:DNA-binding response OmpR family regulator